MNIFKLPRTKVIFKDDVLESVCRNKRVLHLGASDEPFQVKRAKEGIMLHQRLQKVAKKIIGVDYSRKAINDLKKFGIDNIYFGDVVKGVFDKEIKGDFDIIVCGDIIEHLESPGLALQNIKRFMTKKTRMFITVPNMHCFNNYKSFFTGKEDVHPDHMYWPSYVTMSNIIKRSGLRIVCFNYSMWGRRDEFKGFKAAVYGIMMKMKPYLASALFFEVKL